MIERWKEVCEQGIDLPGVVRCNGEQVFEVGLTWVQDTGEQAAERGRVGL